MSLFVSILSAIGEILTGKMAKADNPLIYYKQKIPVGNRAPWIFPGRGKISLAAGNAGGIPVVTVTPIIPLLP